MQVTHVAQGFDVNCDSLDNVLDVLSEVSWLEDQLLDQRFLKQHITPQEDTLPASGQQSHGPRNWKSCMTHSPCRT